MKTFNKRLYKSKDNKVIAGVMGGFGEYFDIDPVLLRVLYILLTVFTAAVPGIIAYIFMALVMPYPPKVIHEESKEKNKEPKE